MRKAILNERGQVVNLEKLEEEKSQAYKDLVRRTQEHVMKKYHLNKER